MSAVVESVLVDLGDVVERGQVIATLESSVERATVAQARARSESDADIQAKEARLAYEMRRVERSRQLVERGVISETELAPSPNIRTLRVSDAEMFTKAFLVCLAERRDRPGIS